MVFFGVVFEGEVLRALVQILQAQQSANPLVEWELVADHNVGAAAAVGASIAENTLNIKQHAPLRSSDQSGSAIFSEPKISKMQRDHLCLQRFEAIIIMNDIVGLAQPLLPGNL